MSDVSNGGTELAVGTPVQVFVPWQTFKDKPYWEGTIGGVFEKEGTTLEGVDGTIYLISKPGFEDCTFHEKFVRPV